MTPLAAQLYTLRTLPLEAALAAASAAGYEGVEILGTHDRQADDLKALLDASNLKAVSCHVPLGTLEADLDSFLAFQGALGNRTVVVPYLDANLRAPGAEGWRALGERLEALALKCQDAGFSLLYHNHDFEMADVEGQSALAHLLSAAPHVGLELDVAWVVRGGRDPLALLEAYAGRCPRAHVKDIAPPGENQDEDGWADVGSGTLDWAALLPALARAGTEWLVVEHDLPRDPAASVRRSAEFLRGALAEL